MLINESRTACKYTPGRQGARIDKILCHHWGVTGQKHEDVVDYFSNPTKGAQTSAHFVVSDGKVHCIVSPTDTAWHADDWNANITSVGIEMRPEATDGDYRAAAWLVKWLRSTYGDIPLKAHREFTPTLCPGKWDLARLDREARGTTVSAQKFYRPVPSFIPVSQDYGSNPTENLPADHWLIRTFGNYQPRGHTGRDYSAAEGSDVYAVTDGTVLWADWATKLPGDNSHAGWVSRWYISKTFAGICVVIDHGGFLSVSAHLSRTDLNVGDRVKGGQRIAATGNTGGSTGPHLHWEAIAKPYAWGNGMYGRVTPDRYLANVTTLAPGYTGGTTSPATATASQDFLEEFFSMDQKKINAGLTAWARSAEGSAWLGKAVIDRTFKDTQGKSVSLGSTLRYDRDNWDSVRRVEAKLDAVVDGVSAILDRSPEAFEVDPEKAYAEIGRATVAALKGAA